VFDGICQETFYKKFLNDLQKFHILKRHLKKCLFVLKVFANIVREKLFEKSLSRALFKKLSILIIICVLMFRLPYLLPAGDCDKQKRPQRIAILIIIYFESFWGESSREGLFAKSSSLVKHTLNTISLLPLLI
jgi:hypothetical protein